MAVVAHPAAATAWQAPVPAVDGSEAIDAQCLSIASLALAAAPEGEQRQAMSGATMFFQGRLSRLPDARVEALLWEQSRLINATNQQPLMQRCGAMMVSSGTALEAVGRRLGERERGAPAR